MEEHIWGLEELLDPQSLCQMSFGTRSEDQITLPESPDLLLEWIKDDIDITDINIYENTEPQFGSLNLPHSSWFSEEYLINDIDITDINIINENTVQQFRFSLKEIDGSHFTINKLKTLQLAYTHVENCYIDVNQYSKGNLKKSKMEAYKPAPVASILKFYLIDNVYGNTITHCPSCGISAFFEVSGHIGKVFYHTSFETLDVRFLCAHFTDVNLQAVIEDSCGTIASSNTIHISSINARRGNGRQIKKQRTV